MCVKIRSGRRLVWTGYCVLCSVSTGKLCGVADRLLHSVRFLIQWIAELHYCVRGGWDICVPLLPAIGPLSALCKAHVLLINWTQDYTILIKYFVINYIYLIHTARHILSTFTNQCHCLHLHSQFPHLPHTLSYHSHPLHCHSTTYHHHPIHCFGYTALLETLQCHLLWEGATVTLWHTLTK